MAWTKDDLLRLQQLEADFEELKTDLSDTSEICEGLADRLDWAKETKRGIEKKLSAVANDLAAQRLLFDTLPDQVKKSLLAEK